MEIKRLLSAGRVFLIIGAALLLSIPLFMGCATLQHEDNVLAVVDDTPITEADLAYALNVSHRREDLSARKTLDISSYIEKLIDDRLIFDEALRMGLDQLPDVRKKMEAHIVQKSVTRLHDEEILGKVSVTDEDIFREYAQNYFHFGAIEVNSEDEAKAIKAKISGGEDFSEIARIYSLNDSKEKGGELLYPRDTVVQPLREALSALKPGECSDVINVQDKYYLVKLFDNKETDEIFNTRKKDIAQKLKKQRQKEAEEGYVKTLREKATITIKDELLAEIDFGAEKEALEKWEEDTRPLAEVNASVMTVGDFVNSVQPMNRRSVKTVEEKKKILDSLIDVKVVNQEALSRHYEEKDLKDEVERYENHILKTAFMNTVIYPQIHVSDEKFRDYYERNQQQYVEPGSYKLQQLIAETEEEAEDARKSTSQGADFLWLAKKKLPSSVNEDMINVGWLERGRLPEPLREHIDSMKPGDVSPVFKNNDFYVIVRLLDKTAETVKDFESVRKEVEKALIAEEFKKVLAENMATLRKDARIIIHDDAVRTLEKKLAK
jgi:parvulin-like peptidyl-prolyl isomerase